MKISIILPTYNRESTIARSIKSILKQTWQDFELIIVDDGSTDNTCSVVESFSDSRIKYYRQENAGASSARNIGVTYSETDIIAFCDSDDVWKEEKLEKQVRFMEVNPSTSLVYTAYMMHTRDRDIRVPKEGNICDKDILSGLLVKNSIGAPTVMVRKDAFQAVDGFDISMKSLEDWDFAIKVAKEYQIGFIDEILVDAYDTGTGISHSIAPYFQSRCLMVARYAKDMQNLGVFDTCVTDILERANANGILDNVKQMLMIYIQDYN